jgi:hypothetical protein
MLVFRAGKTREMTKKTSGPRKGLDPERVARTIDIAIEKIQAQLENDEPKVRCRSGQTDPAAA